MKGYGSVDHSIAASADRDGTARSQVVFRLAIYVASGEPQSALALYNLHAMCKAHWPDCHQIEVVDVLRDPERARADGVLVTPTLIKTAPAPLQRIVGCLSHWPEIVKRLTTAAPSDGDSPSPPVPVKAAEEIRELFSRLGEVERRLEALGAGEVDAVDDPRRGDFRRRRLRPVRRREVARYASILDALSKHVAVLDAQGVIVLVNEAWRRFASANAFTGSAFGIGSSYLEICDRAAKAESNSTDIGDAARAAAGIRSVLEGGCDQFAMEYACHSPSEQRWFRMTVNRIALESGIGAVVLHDNVTERESARLARQQSADLLQAVNDGAADNISVKDVHGRYQLCNAAFVRTIGRPVEELIGRDDLTLFGENSARPLIESDRSVIESGGTFDGEYTLSGRAGAKTYHVTKSPFRDRRGVIVGVVAISRDITERKQAEAELRRSRSLLSMAGRLGRIGAWSVDLSGDRVIWSDETCAIHGVPPGTSPTYEEALAFYAPEWCETIRQAALRCSQDATPFDLELEIITTGQVRTWVRVVGEAVRGTQDAITSIQGAIQDLSERKRAERETQQLALRLSNTLENITDALYIVDRQWRITYLNSKAERHASRPRDQLLGQVLWDLFPSLEATEFGCGYRKAMDERIAITVDAYFAPLEGWFVATAYPSEDGLAIDFRRTSEERATRRHLELLQASVSQLKEIVLITDAAPRGERGPRIQFVNAEFTRVTGYSSEEVLGRSPRLLLGEQTDLNEVERIEKALSRFEPVHAELLNYTRSGEARWVEMDIVPVAQDRQNITHFVMTGRDITARKQDQDALCALYTEMESRVRTRTAQLEEARREAEAANRAKSVFIATMSHEIRTPLNGVIGMIDVLGQSSLQPHQVDMVNLIRDSADSLGAIIDDILDITKIEAGKLVLERAPLELGNLLEAVCSTLAPVAAKRGVGLTVFVDPAIPDALVGDATRLRQVLVNLIGNAIKFSGVAGSAPGLVAVRAQLTESHSPPQPVTVEITVADNGIGMDEATVKNLFVAFTQADSSTTRRFGGTGLGLAISHTLIGLMAGDIRVTSTPGVGSTFTVRIPFAAADAAGLPAEAPLPLAGLRCRIVGPQTQLAQDLASTITAAGTIVVNSPDLSAAAAEGAVEGRWVWLILPGQSIPDLPDLRAMVNQGQSHACFVVLRSEPGFKPQLVAPALVHLGIHALRRQTLFDAVLLAANGTSESSVHKVAKTASEATPVAGETPSAEDRRPILVVEDNDINRRVILQQVNLLGYAAEVAVNGRAALERWRSGDYALVLTDLHMPEMDGYALAVAIRAEEAGRRRIPIIAATANALREEQLRCRDAGMDDYVTKPIRLTRLKAVLESWVSPAGAADPSASRNAEAIPQSEAVNLQVLVDLVGEDPNVIRDILQSFRTNVGVASKEMERGVRDGSGRVVAEAAHRLKSGARSIGATRLGEVCRQIEEAGARADLERVGALLPRFRKELEVVLAFLDAR